MGDVVHGFLDDGEALNDLRIVFYVAVAGHSADSDAVVRWSDIG
jgi:hypothetical protein